MCIRDSYMGFSDAKDVSLDKLNKWNKDKRFARAYKDDEGDPVLEMDVDLDFAGIPVSGTVDLQNWSASRAGQLVRIDVKAAGGFNLLTSRVVTLNAQGQYSFTLPSNLAAGNYDFYAKASHWLTRKRANVSVPAGGSTCNNFSLINGDVDGDNEVTLADFGLLSDSFGLVLGDSGYNANADLDGDSEVALADFGILSASFGEVGD